MSDLGERFADTTGDLRAVAGARLLPMSADPVSYGAGVAGVRTRAFVLGTLIGGLPRIVGLVFVGAQLETLGAEGIDGLDPAAVVLLALVGVLLSGKPLYSRLRD